MGRRASRSWCPSPRGRSIGTTITTVRWPSCFPAQRLRAGAFLPLALSLVAGASRPGRPLRPRRHSPGGPRLSWQFRDRRPPQPCRPRRASWAGRQRVVRAGPGFQVFGQRGGGAALRRPPRRRQPGGDVGRRPADHVLDDRRRRRKRPHSARRSRPLARRGSISSRPPRSDFISARGGPARQKSRGR